MPIVNWNLTTHENEIAAATEGTRLYGGVSKCPQVKLHLIRQKPTDTSVEYKYVLQYVPSPDGPVQQGADLYDGTERYFRMDYTDGSDDKTEYSGGLDLKDVAEVTELASGVMQFEKKDRERTVAVDVVVYWDTLTINGRVNEFGTKKVSQNITIEKAKNGSGSGSGTTAGDGTPSDTTATTDTSEVPLWEADWSTASIFELDANTPTKAPPKPTVTIEPSTDGKKSILEIKVDKSVVFDSLYKVALVFDIVKDDIYPLYGTDDLIVYSDEDYVITDYASVRVEVDNGHRYNVRCRTIKTVAKEKHTSEWSEWSDTKESMPLAPKKILACSARSSDGINVNSIYLEWTPVATATSYEIQYSTNRNMDDFPDTCTSVPTNDKGTKRTFTVSDSGTSGAKYYVRVRAIGAGEGDAAKSAWSPIADVIIGSAPGAPYAWSQLEKVIAGKPVNLYWTHNTTDGSPETLATLTIKLVYPEFTSGMRVYKGRYYNFKNALYRCIKTGKPTDITDTKFLKKMSNDTFTETIEVPRSNPTVYTYGMHVYEDEYYTYSNALYKCLKDGEPESINDTDFFELIEDPYNPGAQSHYTLKTASLMKDGVVGVNWSVITYGISPEPSPSSEVKTIEIYALPTMTLGVADHQGNRLTTLTSFPIRVKASVTDASGTQKPIGYYLSVMANESYTTRDAIGNPKVVHKDDLVYYNNFDINTPLDTYLSAGDLTLENNISYTLTCIASMDSGLTAEESHDFTVGWDVEQHLPSASVLVNTNVYAAAIRPYCEETIEQWHIVNRRDDGKYVIGEKVDGEVEDITPLVKSAEPIGKNLLDTSVVTDAKNCNAYPFSGGMSIKKTREGITSASSLPMYLIADKTYRLSYTPSGSAYKHYWCDADDDSVEAQISSATFTPAESGYYRIDFCNDGEVGSVLTIRNAQVEVGTDKTTYEEYQGTEVILEKTITGEEVYVSGDKYYCITSETRLVEDVVLSIYRRDHDGGFTEIAKSIPNTNTFVPDPHPALDYARYRIVATSTKTGYVSYYDLPSQPVNCKSVIIQWDEEWNAYDADAGRTTEKTWTGSLLSIPYNIDVSDKRAVDVEMIKYVGRKHPVSYYGTHLGETASWSCAIPKSDKETLYALRRLAAWAGDVYVREPSGVGYWANVVVNFSQKHCDPIVPVSFEITRVEGGV